jgi:hypothetical protein
MLQNITKEQALLILKNRVLLHAALIQKDYDVPALSSALGSHEFFLQVYEGRAFVLRKPQVRNTTIFAAPTNAELTAAILAGLDQAVNAESDVRTILPAGNKKAILQLHAHLSERQADRAWLLRLHSTMHCRGLASTWYKAGATPANVKATRGHVRVPAINEAFFDGVKALTQKEQAMRGRAASTPKVDRLALEI